ncbi:hypothetical protein ETD83_16155 [Actinomadura soli]|uniref:Uncharacterized protein n=1 Tax=Actinomadura soli TaxID=2508997 RepID=A0A5C4JE28_9ACTN|nr:hypothetical protein [Actinomadura soli]TMR00684.1 hypothetical protein ETD83_16155 [Actinomadura soli]
MISDLIRCTGGVLGYTALAGAISIGVATPVGAVTTASPEPRGSVPPICRHAVIVGDRHSANKCREAWLAMYERSRRRSGRGREFARRGDRFDWKFKVRRWPPSSGQPKEPAPRPTVPDAPSASPPAPKQPKSTAPRVSSPTPTRTRGQAQDLDSRPSSLQPVLLLGLLLPAAAAICYPFRHRIYAAAGLPAFSTATTAAAAPPARLTYHPVVDPFAAPVAGLTGPGAVSAARTLALAALDEHSESSLVVVPRPDATVLFGLGEDELLDDDTAGLFIPGNLDAALAYLETELAIRENTGAEQGRRLLLVADCAEEGQRIEALLGRHPGGVSAILLGAWKRDRATINDEGLVDAPSTLGSAFPERLPAISRTEARDRLLATLARQRQDQRSTSKRRSTHRRP